MSVPPRRMPASHEGSVIPGSSSSTVVPIGATKRICATSRNATMMSASRRKNPNDRAQGASERRRSTTTAVQVISPSSSSGFVVMLAAAATPRAHAHQASGCNHRARSSRARLGTVAWLVPVVTVGAVIASPPVESGATARSRPPR